MTRICHTILHKHQIEHQTRVGVLTFENQTINPHFWIELHPDLIIDYRAKMWLKSIK